ncbi:hypothetical protein BKA69DRAFT_1139921 [Paraphysoderma sedebokerense]|nr:hypothetical protein BKA69DRAFT_1139921 [Paraphysoderma sedebokerense]
MKVFVILAVCALALLSNAAPSHCPGGIRVRKEYRDLTPDEWQRFVAAVRKLNEKPSAKGYKGSRYADWGSDHVKYFNDIHFKNVFLPFHRVFVWDFENALREIDPTVVLPYWDWSIDYREPEKAAIFRPEFMGGSQPIDTIEISKVDEDNEKNIHLLNKCVIEGPFKDFKFTGLVGNGIEVNNVCLARGFNQQTGYSSGYASISQSLWQPQNLEPGKTFANPKPRFANGMELQELINKYPVYKDFREKFEYGYHATPHMYIGGYGGSMNSMNSPFEPLFWLHHGFVDFVYHQYQVKYGINHYSSPDKPTEHEDSMPVYGKKVKDYFDIEQLCYKYQPSCFLNPEICKSTSSATSSSSQAPVATQTSSSSVAPSSPASIPSPTPSSSPPVNSGSGGEEHLGVEPPVNESTSIPVSRSTSSSSSSNSATSHPASSTVVSDISSATPSKPIIKETTTPSVNSTNFPRPPYAPYVPPPSKTVRISSSTAPSPVASNLPSETPLLTYRSEYFPKPNPQYPQYPVDPIPPADRYIPPLPKYFVEKFHLNKTFIRQCEAEVEKISRTVEKKVKNGEYIPPIAVYVPSTLPVQSVTAETEQNETERDGTGLTSQVDDSILPISSSVDRIQPLYSLLLAALVVVSY